MDKFLIKLKKLMKKIKHFVITHKKPVIIVGAILVVAIAALITFLVLNSSNEANKAKEEGIKAVTAEGIIKEEEYKGLKFHNVTLIGSNNMYTFSVDVTNTTNEKITIQNVNIPIKNEEGKTIATLLGHIGGELNPNETRTVTANTNADLSDAYTKEITE